MSTLLTKDDLDPDSKQLILYANLDVDHLNRLVENVLQMSRLEAKTLRITRRWDVLDELITTVLARWPDAVADGTLRADLTQTPFLVLFDFDLVEAVLTNLIDN